MNKVMLRNRIEEKLNPSVGLKVIESLGKIVWNQQIKLKSLNNEIHIIKRENK